MSDATTLSDYCATISVAKPVPEVREAIMNDMHIWWSSKVDRDADGATIHFGPSHVRFVFEGPDGLDWLCVDANMIIEDVADTAEWQGTRLRWHLEAKGETTNVTLTHVGLNADLECLDVCTRGWQHFFEHSLRNHLSDAPAAPETR
ncbi:hypothetical protein [Shimia sp.]|uniref:hypothetical protein n=1 Tax=Shimia sp. TaxID=1954381 RepID=UPI0032968098